MAACEPCQVRNEAALSNNSHVTLLAWHFFWYSVWIMLYSETVLFQLVVVVQFVMECFGPKEKLHHTKHRNEDK